MFQDTRTIENKGNEPIVVWLEPWASHYILAPGQTLVAVGSSEKEGRFDVAEYEGGKVGIYVWSGSSVKIFQDGKLIDDWPSIIDDEYGDRLRQFIEGAFGGPGGDGTGILGV